MFAGPGHPEGFTLRASVFNAPQAIHRTVLPAVVTLALSRQGSLLDGCRVEAVSHLPSSMSFRRSRRSRRPSIRCIASSWQDLADWTVAEFPEAQGTLLRDREAPNVFFSFGPWRDLDQALAWRASEGFRQRVTRLRQLLESFEPHLLDPVIRVGH